MAETEFVRHSEHEVTHKGLSTKIDELENRVSVLESTLRGVVVDYATIRERLDMLIKIVNDLKEEFKRMEQDLKEMRNRPSRLWDGFVLAMVSAATGGIVAIFLQLLGR